MGSWSLFFSTCGLSPTLCGRRSFAPFDRLERRVRWNCTSFPRISLARAIAPHATLRHGDAVRSCALAQPSLSAIGWERQQADGYDPFRQAAREGPLLAHSGRPALRRSLRIHRGEQAGARRSVMGAYATAATSRRRYLTPFLLARDVRCSCSLFSHYGQERRF